MITHTMPLADINKAFDLMREGKIDPQRRGILARWINPTIAPRARW